MIHWFQIESHRSTLMLANGIAESLQELEIDSWRVPGTAVTHGQ